jgi:cytochrome d ubiquinol oxidase subunit II
MLSLEEWLAGSIVVSLILYVLFGGADFGAGVWYLAARGERGRDQRHLIAKAIGPIWEANHVWLILAVTILFTAFPPAFARVTTVLHVPLTLLLLAIVGRGATFSFRSHDVGANAVHGIWDWLFAGSSVVAPLLLGVCLSSLSTGLAHAPQGSFFEGFVAPWANWFALTVGLLALAVVSWLAALYLWVEATDNLKPIFRQRALGAAMLVHGLAFVVLLWTRTASPRFWQMLTETEWGWMVVSGVAMIGCAMFFALWSERPRLVRALAAGEVSGMILGWALSLYPYLVLPDLTLFNTAAPPSTLVFLLGALTAGALVLFPCLYYLYRIFKGSVLLGDTSER